MLAVALVDVETSPQPPPIDLQPNNPNIPYFNVLFIHEGFLLMGSNSMPCPVPGYILSDTPLSGVKLRAPEESDWLLKGAGPT